MRIRVVVLALLTVPFLRAVAADPPPLRFVAPATASDVKIALKDAKLVHQLVIENASKDAMTGVTVEVQSPLAITCKLAGDVTCDKPFNIGALQSQPIALTADPVAPGTYSAVVSVIGKDTRHSMTLSITRPEPAFPVKLVGGAKTAAQTVGTLTVGVIVQDTSGKGAKLNAPTVLLTRKAPNARGQVEATFGSAFLEDNEKRTPIGTTVDVPKNGSKKVLVRLRDLDEPGEYTGFVRLTSPDMAASLDVPLRVWIKEGAGCAGLLIFIGVATSFLLRTLVRAVRPALVQYRDAARLAADVRAIRQEIETKFGALEPREKSVLDGFEARLAKIAENIDGGESATANAAMVEIGEKLTMTLRWVNVRRRLAALPPTTQTALAPKLQHVTTFLENPGMDNVATVTTALGELEDAVNVAHAEESGKNTAFSETLHATETAPVGFDDPAWTKLRDDTVAALDAAAADTDEGARRKKLDAAYRAYTAEVVRRLREYALLRITRVDRDPNIEQAKKPELKKNISAIVDTLAAAETDAAAGKLREAAIAANTAAADLQKIIDEEPALLASSDTASAAPTPTGAGLGGGIASLLVRNLRLDRTGATTIAQYLLGIDALVALITLVAAVILGLLLLWNPDIDWGSPEDYAVALLWGLGLHQVGNSLAGYAGVSDKLTK